MRMEVQFQHMSRSEALENFVSEKLESAVNGCLNARDCHVLVWLINEHSRTQKGVPEFKCEIEVRYPPRRDIFVAKSADDMYQAVSDAVDAIRGQMREDSKRRVHMRNNPVHQFAV